MKPNNDNNKKRENKGRSRHYHRYIPQAHKKLTPDDANGPPGMFVTCEKTKEMKCQREGMEIIRYYYHKQMSGDPSKEVMENEVIAAVPKKEDSKGDEVMSLEDEIALLKKGGRSGAGGGSASAVGDPFSVYDIGMQGISFIIFDPKDGKGKKDSKKTKEEEEEEEEEDIETGAESRKKQKITETTSSPASKTTEIPSGTDDSQPLPSPPPPSWDPVTTLNEIITDIQSKTPTIAPSSRFVIRMIPMQSTCYAGLKEIELTAKTLIAKHLLPLAESSSLEEITFAVAFTRRNCSHIKRNDVIAKVALLMSHDKFKVKLKDPMYSIVIEVCKTFCGVSIVKNVGKLGNFNVFALRQEMEGGEEEEEKSP